RSHRQCDCTLQGHRSHSLLIIKTEAGASHHLLKRTVFMGMPLTKRGLAEFIGTFWLVFGGCGSAVLAAAFPNMGIGFLGVALAFGLTVMTMAYAIGHISGCHLNPAVSIGLAVSGRFRSRDLGCYLVAQVTGGIFAAAILYLIASGKPGFDLTAGFASN